MKAIRMIIYLLQKDQQPVCLSRVDIKPKQRERDILKQFRVHSKYTKSDVFDVLILLEMSDFSGLLLV